MESIRIDFEVPKSPVYTVEYLTERAKCFVLGLLSLHGDGVTDGELAVVADSAVPKRTAEKEREELACRWQQMRNNPSSAHTSQEVFDRLESLL